MAKELLNLKLVNQEDIPAGAVVYFVPTILTTNWPQGLPADWQERDLGNLYVDISTVPTEEDGVSGEMTKE